MSDSELLPGGAPPALPNSWNPRLLGSCVPGTPFYVPAAGEVSPARANLAATCNCVGLALHVGVSGERIATRFLGLLQLTTEEWADVLDTGVLLVTGSQYYVSAASPAGKLTRTAPSEGSFIAPVGIAISELSLLIKPTITRHA